MGDARETEGVTLQRKKEKVEMKMEGMIKFVHAKWTYT